MNSLDGCYLMASADLEDGTRVVLYTDRASVSTARIVNAELTDVHRHAHRDAAVDDFRARAGLLKEKRNAR